METLIAKSEITEKTVDCVKNQVIALLKEKGYFVAESKNEVFEYLSNFSDDVKSEINEEEAQDIKVDGEKSGCWQHTISVSIKGFYVDPGSSDYIYMVDVTED